MTAWIVIGLLVLFASVGAIVAKRRLSVGPRALVAQLRSVASSPKMDWAMLEALREVDAIGTATPPVLMVDEALSNAAYAELKERAERSRQSVDVILNGEMPKSDARENDRAKAAYDRQWGQYTQMMVEVGFRLEPNTATWSHPDGRSISHEEVMRDGVERIQNGHAFSEAAARDDADAEYQRRCAEDREQYQRQLGIADFTMSNIAISAIVDQIGPGKGWRP